MIWNQNIKRKNDEIPFQTNDNYFNDIYLNVKYFFTHFKNNLKQSQTSNIISFPSNAKNNLKRPQTISDNKEKKSQWEKE